MKAIVILAALASLVACVLLVQQEPVEPPDNLTWMLREGSVLTETMWNEQNVR